MLDGIEDEDVAICLAICIRVEVVINQHFAVGRWPGVSNKEQMGIRVQRLEVKMIEPLRPSRREWTLARRRRERTGQRDVLLQHKMVRRRGCIKLHRKPRGQKHDEAERK